MRFRLIITLASALFKSYLRSSRNASISFYSKPKVMLAIDITLFIVPTIALMAIIGSLPAEINVMLVQLFPQAMISLPLFMTGAVIVSGLMFELGQGSAISSSEAVNWWPVSPREYVVASALSTSSLYSAFLALSAGISLPVAIEFGLLHVWFVVILLLTFSLLLGSFIVESLKAVMNRVSATAYKKSGRFTLVARLIALVLLFTVIQMAFQPYVLSWFFGRIVAGIEVIWVLPFVWPSAAIASLFKYELVQTVLYTLCAVFFTLALCEAASQLRRRYWSPVPISISMVESREYIPYGPTGKGFGFSSLAVLLAMKEFRALTRRKDLARFIAIPIVISISFLAPVLVNPGDMSGRAPVFFLAGFIPLFVPLMLSSISIGQEGASMMNLLCLPIRPVDLIKGKLAPAWLISGIATFGVIIVLELLAPLGLTDIVAIVIVSAIAIIINSFLGLGVGSRWPDYTIGARSRYVTLKGFMVGFALCGLATITVFAPVGLHIVTSSGVRNGISALNVDLLLMLGLSISLGVALIVVSYRFCKKGVESLLTIT